MEFDLRAAAGVVPLTALILGACVSQRAYDEQAAQARQSQARVQQLQAQQGAPSNLALSNRLKGPGAASA